MKAWRLSPCQQTVATTAHPRRLNGNCSNATASTRAAHAGRQKLSAYTHCTRAWKMHTCMRRNVGTHVCLCASWIQQEHQSKNAKKKSFSLNCFQKHNKNKRNVGTLTIVLADLCVFFPALQRKSSERASSHRWAATRRLASTPGSISNTC